MSRTVALVTLYNPTEDCVDNIIRICRQVDHTFLCDNSSRSNSEMFAEMHNATYIYNSQNLGLSAAFNIVLKSNTFAWSDDDYVIFFDQDTAIPQNHISLLIDEYINLEKQGIDIGCMGPMYYNTSSNMIEVPKIKRSIDDKSFDVNSIITTSMLCRYSSIQQIGFWNEEIFLDMADWDMCWRLHANNKTIVLTGASSLTHSIGSGEKRVGPIRLRVGQPFREYYETRDCVYLLQKKYVPCKNKIRFHLQLTLRPLLHLLFLDDKEQRKYYIRLGYKHAKMKKTGELKQSDLWKQ